MLVDYHIHVLGHRGGCYTRELLEEYFAAARAQKIDEIGLTEHDEYAAGLDQKALEEALASYPHLSVRLGLEISYWPGREKEIAGLAQKYNFDYLIGSVHHIENWMFDHPDFRAAYSEWDFALLYQRYFGLVEKLASCGCFDVVGHFDLIKVFGYRPPGDVVSLAAPALMAIRKAGLAVEVNTAGLYKPCGEIYPAEDLLARCYELNIPVTLGSDAHHPGEVGRDLVCVRDLLYRIGYRKIATFSQRRRLLKHL
ncbi:MAG: histidinol-phosphatase HisJ family protein [Firmicutes bacterium]|nr:histidinol-phosphatase HisJ family protein [Bacillota bacterium]